MIDVNPTEGERHHMMVMCSGFTWFHHVDKNSDTDVSKMSLVRPSYFIHNSYLGISYKIARNIL